MVENKINVREMKKKERNSINGYQHVFSVWVCYFFVCKV